MIRHQNVTDAPVDVNLGIDVGAVAILNRSTDVEVWTRTDGTEAAVEANDCRVIPPGARRTIEVTTNGATHVSLVTETGTADVEIEA